MINWFSFVTFMGGYLGFSSIRYKQSLSLMPASIIELPTRINLKPVKEYKFYFYLILQNINSFGSLYYSFNLREFNSSVISSIFFWLSGYKNINPAAIIVMIAGTQLINIIIPGIELFIAVASCPL